IPPRRLRNALAPTRASMSLLKSLPQPVQGSRRSVPGQQLFIRARDGFRFVAKADILGKVVRKRFGAQQISRYVVVCLPGRCEQRPSGTVVSLFPESHQGSAVVPASSGVAFVAVEKLPGRTLVAGLEKSAEQHVPDALVIVGIQAQHFLVVADGVLASAHFP